MKYLILLTSILLGCSHANSNKESNSQKQADNNTLNKKLLDNLQIPKSWTEITYVDNVWTYSIPCRNDRELQSILLTTVDNQDFVSWNTGTEGQGYILNQIIMQSDSIIFETFLPYDTSSVILFSVKYLEYDKNIVQWGADGTYCTFIPTKDTSMYIKIQLPCNENGN